jgi:hypothetical protein
MSDKEKMEIAMRELREWRAKKGIPAADLAAPQPQKVWIKFTRDCCHDTSDRPQAFTVVGNLHTVQDQVESDSEETGCLRYVVLIDGDQYVVWRDQ